ncbi:RagB/SusD family nutrient uptake outer membrane protein [Fulvivirga maritima]|uniref:RagB/SusD family nutrient uptake outer membrane protein n=1 Tax=Fulvivirga maritima TaxID=2904247 RepID=UPI001F3F24AB|nr:RagB/SusD family nutrient uptake outer membrane protein [Fulvivirga maritima]UII27658.1 RagB/SusD family nutrient uptake outer membrane protein [Fulvivirga maritima]
MKSIYTFILLLLLSACDQEEWLEIRSDKKQVVPSSLKDYQAILDNALDMNTATPSLGEVSADDYYITQQDWETMTSGASLIHRKAYLWQEDIYQDDDQVPSWNMPYATIYYANAVLEGIKKVEVAPDEKADFDRIRGTALFHRSWCFFQLAQVFCQQYEAASAASQLGLPLRTDPDINVTYQRSSLEDTYQKIIDDLETALPLLPGIAQESTRASKASVQALLAKVYLQTGRYSQALLAADESLQLYHELMDYNDLDPSASYPFEILNPETVFYNRMLYVSEGPLSNDRMRIAPELYNSYAEHDLRKSLFYREADGDHFFRGSYNNGNFFAMYYFSGIATDELYLIRSECYARTGKVTEALHDLNTLLQHRYEQGHFVPIAISNAEQALERILLERRKELVFRGIRWPDIKRYIAYDGRDITLQRQLGNSTYSLAPHDLRYTLPLPYNVVSISGIEQNER